VIGFVYKKNSYLLKRIWLPSFKTEVDIDRVMHYTAYDFSATTA
jgi:hypothetical protein